MLQMPAVNHDLYPLKKLLVARGYKNQKDNTHHIRGGLWIITDCDRNADAPFFDYLNAEFGTYFLYAPKGARTTRDRRAWFWVPGHEPGMRLRFGYLETP